MSHIQQLRKLNRNHYKTKRKDLTSAEVWQLESLSARLSEDGLKKNRGRGAPFEAGRPRDSLWSHHGGQDEVAPVVSSTLHSQVANHQLCDDRLEERRSCTTPSVRQKESLRTLLQNTSDDEMMSCHNAFKDQDQLLSATEEQEGT
jgi:hypothetical protein